MSTTKLLLTLLLPIFCLFLSSNALFRQSLGGKWNIHDDDYEYNTSGTVPGGIYSDLMDNDIIGDVFYGFNDVDTRWVSHRNWTYSREFSVLEEYHHTNIRLAFHGLDTFATIYINDIEIGQTDNMFVRYYFDVKPYLISGVNKISVKFQSPVEVAKKLYEIQSEKYVVPPSCVPDVYNGECHINHIRKMQASFAWDWGPAFPSMGIWKEVYLEAYESSIIEDVSIHYEYIYMPSVWECQINVYFAKNSKESIQGNLTISADTELGLIGEAFEIEVNKNADDEFVDTRKLNIPWHAVELWWPNGHGDSKVYKFSIKFNTDTETHQRDVNIGFRRVLFTQQPVGNGTSFYFNVNDYPIFAKGSNSIPLSILPEKSYDPKLIRSILQSAKDANMNMLRVWGGGLYESEEFYNVADEMGIMIWQDFMFACAMYPTNEEFLSSVRQEVRQQVRRISNHASVVLWAGNNENEWALRSNWYGTKQNFSLYHEDYIKLYVDTIRNEVFKSDESRSFVVSSPSNGLRSEEENFVAEEPQDPLFGDIHHYNNLNDAWDVENYPTPRFSSEYGFQSIPSMSSLLTATNNTEDLKISSEFMNHRQHVNGGYILLRAMITRRMTLPNVSSENFHKAVIFYSQIYQAIGVKIQTEHYRASRNQLSTISNEGYTMGALYWQLNDVWVAPSWSGIDFTNKWKMLHYFARDFFANILITGQYHASEDVLKVFIISDDKFTISNASAVIKVYRWDSFLPVYTDIRQEDVIGIQAREIVSLDLTSFITNAGCENDVNALYDCFIYLDLLDENGEKLSPSNYVFPVPLKDANLKKSIVSFKVDAIEKYLDGSFGIHLTATQIALFVWIETKNIPGRFSENGFLQITEFKTVTFHPDNEISTEELFDNIAVTHYLDNNYM